MSPKFPNFYLVPVWFMTAPHIKHLRPNQNHEQAATQSNLKTGALPENMLSINKEDFSF